MKTSNKPFHEWSNYRKEQVVCGVDRIVTLGKQAKQQQKKYVKLGEIQDVYFNR